MPCFFHSDSIAQAHLSTNTLCSCTLRSHSLNFCFSMTTMTAHAQCERALSTRIAMRACQDKLPGMRRRRTVFFVDFQLFAALFVIAYVFSICLILSVKVCEDIQLAVAVPLKPNSITLAGSKLVRSLSATRLNFHSLGDIYTCNAHRTV